MKSRFLLVLLAVFSFLQISGCRSKSTTTFRVGLRGLPERIDPRGNEINIYHYINIHIFSPMFERTQANQLNSVYFDLLKTRARNGTYKEFSFCLKPGLSYSDGSLVAVSDLLRSLVSVTKINKDLPEIERVTPDGERCILVELKSGDATYFDKLTTIDTAVLKSGSTDLDVPKGIGPYEIESKGPSLIVLKKTKYAGDAHFQQIEFHRVQNVEQARSAQIDDWNHMWQHLGRSTPIPNDVKERSFSIRQPLFRSLVILNKVKEPTLRKLLSNCFDISSYLRSTGQQVVPISGFLPKGLHGSEISSEAKSRDAHCEKLPRKTVRFFHFYPELHEAIAVHFRSVRGPVGFVPKLISVDEAVRLAFAPEEFMMPIMMDAPNPSAGAFFRVMTGEKSIFHSQLPELEKALRGAGNSRSGFEAETRYRRAHELVMKSGYIIPLGQVEATFFYPKVIKSVNLVDPINGFPLIHQLELR
jgi:MarR-like DNA-binding transcriptional regulator SgrR of sgrS sRNA